MPFAPPVLVAKVARPAFKKTGWSQTHWPKQVKAVGADYWRFAGTVLQLIEKEQRRLKGLSERRPGGREGCL